MERAKTSGRVDDTEEIILKRLRTYNDMSRPVVDLYKKKGLVLEVDGGKDKEIVWEEVKKGLKSRPETSSGSACCILF